MENFNNVWRVDVANKMSETLAKRMGPNWKPDTRIFADRGMPGVKHIDGLKEIRIVEYPATGLHYTAVIALNDNINDETCSCHDDDPVVALNAALRNLPFVRAWRAEAKAWRAEKAKQNAIKVSHE